MRLKVILFSVIIFICAVLVTGCNVEVKKTEETTELTIAAAADLTYAFGEIGKEFEKATGSKLTFSFGSTGMLAEQIENGAPFDVFAAANVKVIDDLEARGRIIAGTQKLYAIGRIGLATKAGSSLKVENLNDLTKPEIRRISIANPAHAPYGLAAKQAMEAAGVWEALKDKLVYGKNTHEALTLLKTGNTEVGIVALSIAREDEVRLTLIDSKLHEPLKQAVAVIKGTKREELSRQFVSYITGKKGRLLMEKYGFTILEGAE